MCVAEARKRSCIISKIPNLEPPHYPDRTKGKLDEPYIMGDVKLVIVYHNYLHPNSYVLNLATSLQATIVIFQNSFPVCDTCRMSRRGDFSFALYFMVVAGSCSGTGSAILGSRPRSEVSETSWHNLYISSAQYVTGNWKLMRTQ